MSVNGGGPGNGMSTNARYEPGDGVVGVSGEASEDGITTVMGAAVVSGS